MRAGPGSGWARGARLCAGGAAHGKHRRCMAAHAALQGPFRAASSPHHPSPSSTKQQHHSLVLDRRHLALCHPAALSRGHLWEGRPSCGERGRQPPKQLARVRLPMHAAGRRVRAPVPSCCSCSVSTLVRPAVPTHLLRIGEGVSGRAAGLGVLLQRGRSTGRARHGDGPRQAVARRVLREAR